MKNLLILVVLLGIGYYIYTVKFADKVGLDAIAPKVELQSSSRSFDAVSAQLTQDMNSIPASLDGAAATPAHAYEVKRRVRPYLNLHPEYQTLTRVCDLIIGADAERHAFQQSDRAEQNRTTFHSFLESDSLQKKAALPNPAIQQEAIHQRTESTWNEHRAQTAQEVARLLDTLKGKTI